MAGNSREDRPGWLMLACGTVISGADPSRIIFYPQISLNNPPIPFVLKVETTVVDQGGHALEYPFSKMFNAGSGNSFVQGEVWDNASGQLSAKALARGAQKGVRLTRILRRSIICCGCQPGRVRVRCTKKQFGSRKNGSLTWKVFKQRKSPDEN